jgi:hypothetical protein
MRGDNVKKRLLSLLIALSLMFAGCIASDLKFIPVDLPLARHSEQAEEMLFALLSQSKTLSGLAPNLLLFGGAKEQDGIFVTENHLIENTKPIAEGVLEQNIKNIEAFLDARNLPAWLMLIPTAVAIKQHELPPLAELYNQKSLINTVYDRLSGRITSVDAYSELFASNDQYIYYRTDSSLTGLGGYCVYRALTARLGITPRSIDQFEVDHLTTDYYGALYARSSFKSIEPDLVTIYRFSRTNRQYKLTHWDNTGLRSYYTLFPRHLEVLFGPQNVVLGGFSPRMDVSVKSPYEESFLIFSDNTVLSYLPFFLAHFGNVTVLDLTRAGENELASLDMDDYDQVMFAFSVDSFINRPVAAGAAALIKSPT